MSFKSTLKLDSKFFDKSARQQAFGAVAYQSAQNFRQSLKQKMIDSKPAGRVESIGRGSGFDTRFRRSARGQRPAIQTRKLLNSIYAYRRGENSASVEVTALDENGENYGERLQNKMARQVMTDADRAEAQVDLNNRATAALISLL